MRVLFVDEEPRVLEAIERLFLDLDVEWETCFASNGVQALTTLQAAPVDVIVSDMRVRTKDGVALLDRVSELDPRVVRIVLSGQTDEASALRAVPVAHQFLSKPCAADTLKRVIENTCALHLLLADTKMQSIVGQVARLPSAPRLFTELSQLLGDDSADATRVAAVIQQDPAMASKLLHVANSSFFASAKAVSDVKTAVVRLGLRTLRNLALGVGAFEAARSAQQTLGVSIDELQRRSLEIARLASRLAEKSADADSAFMAGLVCDLGQLVLATVAPDKVKLARTEAARSNVLPHVAERALWGVSHAEVGAFLLGLWGLPNPIVEAVANHHTPDRNAHEHCGLPQLIWLSACIVEGTPPDPALVERFQLNTALERSKQIASGAAA